MKTAAYIAHTPQKRLKQIFEDYTDIFMPLKEERDALNIPPGWVDILEIAAKEATTCQEYYVQVQRIFVQKETLTADFTSGSKAAQRMFLSTIEEARAYCPCCGTIWSDQEKMRVLCR